jgi:hypothetical protein
MDELHSFILRVHSRGRRVRGRSDMNFSPFWGSGKPVISRVKMVEWSFAHGHFGGGIDAVLPRDECHRDRE